MNNFDDFDYKDNFVDGRLHFALQKWLNCKIILKKNNFFQMSIKNLIFKKVLYEGMWQNTLVTDFEFYFVKAMRLQKLWKYAFL